MSKGKKLFLLLFFILIAGMLLSILISYQWSINLPFTFLPLEDYPVIGDWLPLIAFYLASILLIVTLISFFIVIFYPKTISSFNLEKSLGHMRITKKAIEGIVKEMLIDKQLIMHPTISVKMTKRKIKIVVKGELATSKELFIQTEHYGKELKNDLHQLIGSKVKININVKFVSFQKNQKKPRVS